MAEVPFRFFIVMTLLCELPKRPPGQSDRSDVLRVEKHEDLHFGAGGKLPWLPVRKVQSKLKWAVQCLWSSWGAVRSPRTIREILFGMQGRCRNLNLADN